MGRKSFTVGLEGVIEVANEIVQETEGTSVFVFIGELGSGKTTLIKEICRELKVVDPVQSPTFSIVNEYRTSENLPVYHFDFYRISSVEEAIAMGVDDYIFSGYICMIEWPERIAALLPAGHLEIMIESEVGPNRTYYINKHG